VETSERLNFVAGPKRQDDAVRVVLITWLKDAEERVTTLRGLADQIDVVAPKGPPELKALAVDPPDAIVIDLDRRPSEGLVLGIALRRQAGTRHVPQVYAGGQAEKVERVRGILTDAHYADWGGLATQVRAAIERPPADPVVPDAMAPYGGRTLEQKLGLTGCATFRLIDPPAGFAKQVETARNTDGPAELVMLFVRTPAELQAELQPALDAVTDGGTIWIAWPKGGKTAKGDLTEPVVRERGMAAGWVDFKVASIDETWSGLRFKQRS
jgi:hypothetical protein